LELAKIESLYNSGQLTKMEMDQLKSIIIARGREVMQTRLDQEEYDSSSSSSRTVASSPGNGSAQTSLMVVK